MTMPTKEQRKLRRELASLADELRDKAAGQRSRSTSNPKGGHAMTNGRNKGAAAERELAAAIRDQLGVRLVRNLEPPRSGGADLYPHPDEAGAVADELRCWAIEVKRHARATPALLGAWWRQATEQAAEVDRYPALAYRADRAPWRFVVPLTALRPDLPSWEGAEWTAELSLSGFCALVREGMT
jgi:Holliday junction resolvase